MIDFVEKWDQLYVKLSLELNVIKTNHFCVKKDMDNNIEFRHKIGTRQEQKKEVKIGLNSAEVPCHLQV